MKITINQHELANAIKGLNLVVKHKGSVPVLSSVKLKAVAGVVTLSGTNLKEYLTYTFSGASAEGEEHEYLLLLSDLKELSKGKAAHKRDLSFIHDPVKQEVACSIADTAIIRYIKTGLAEELPASFVHSSTLTVCGDDFFERFKSRNKYYRRLFRNCF